MSIVVTSFSPWGTRELWDVNTDVSGERLPAYGLVGFICTFWTIITRVEGTLEGVHPSIHPFTQQLILPPASSPTHPSTHPFTHSPIHLPSLSIAHLPTHPLTPPSTYPPIYSSTYPSTHPSIHLSFHPSIHPPIHLPNYVLNHVQLIFPPKYLCNYPLLSISTSTTQVQDTLVSSGPLP